jgi:hypothetical protein
LAQPASRPRFPLPLSPAQAAQLHAPRAPLTAWPHLSATRLPPSCAASSPWQLGPPVSFVVLAHASPARPPPSPSRLIASPLRHARPQRPPRHCTRPVPSPPPTRAISIDVSAIPAIMASSSVLAVPSIPLPLPGAYKRTRPSPVPSTPAPAISSAFPRANRASAAALPRRSGEPRSSLPSELWSN